MPYERFCLVFDLKPSGPERSLDSGVASASSSILRPPEDLAPDALESQLRASIREDFEMVQKVSA